MVPGYVGYLLLNALMGKTRAWMMEQGHCVAAIDSVNLLIDNMKPAHKERYQLSDEGLTTFVRDFYSYAINNEGKQESPRGSHVNHNTAGGFLEGGYLGFASVQYVHVPLPHERLVVFLSDGAQEEQKGGDWAPRFWRAEDSGLITPIMIFNGRRIDQRSTTTQLGGASWYSKYLKIHNFDPIIFDGRDPAAFAWAVFEMEIRLKRYVKALESPNHYPVKMPYGIAVAPKGAGFYGEGTNDAHNLPLVKNPYYDELTRERFNFHTQRLWVNKPVLEESVAVLNNHEEQGRIHEKDHPVSNRKVKLEHTVEPHYHAVPHERTEISQRVTSCPMAAIDKGFVSIVSANPQIRPRVGNPDEIRSNRMTATLDLLKFRSETPEGDNSESISGSVITVLNEEAVSGAAFGNKGGINIIVTYEAFGAKMFGAARQEVIFSQHLMESGQPPEWLSVPIVLASHTWENGKNEQSHQDPSMAESMYGELSHISRVFFPADYNTCAVLMNQIYTTHGQIWTIVASKRNIADLFNKDEARELYQHGAIRLTWSEYRPEEAKVALLAMGAYQLEEVLRTSARLREKEIAHTVSYILEPGKFRNPRSNEELEFQSSSDIRKQILPSHIEHVFLATHTRPEIIAGSLSDFIGRRSLSQFGFINHGGTLNAKGLLYMNASSWAHMVRSVAKKLEIPDHDLLDEDERNALDGKKSPDRIIV
jgi:phosphoketolase